MNTLRQAVDEYLALRQAMGFKLHEEGRLLPRFIDFLEDHGEAFITTDLAVRWATQCRATVTRPIHARKFRLPGCCPTVHGGQSPIFTTTMKSPDCFRLPANWVRPRDCVPPLTLPPWVCLRLPG